MKKSGQIEQASSVRIVGLIALVRIGNGILGWILVFSHMNIAMRWRLCRFHAPDTELILHINIASILLLSHHKETMELCWAISDDGSSPVSCISYHLALSISVLRLERHVSLLGSCRHDCAAVSHLSSSSSPPIVTDISAG